MLQNTNKIEFDTMPIVHNYINLYILLSNAVILNTKYPTIHLHLR